MTNIELRNEISNCNQAIKAFKIGCPHLAPDGLSEAPSVKWLEMQKRLCVRHPQRSTINTRPPATPAGNTAPPTMTIHELNEEIRDRLALARHAKRKGLKFARLWHVENALYVRRQMRTGNQ